MELMAVIAGLEALKKEGVRIKIYSDSQYVVNAIEKGWLKTGSQLILKEGKKIKTSGLGIPNSPVSITFNFTG